MGNPVTVGGLDASQAQDALNQGMEDQKVPGLALAPPSSAPIQPPPIDKRVSGDSTRNPLGQHSRPNNRTK